MIKAIISDADGTLVNTIYLIRHGQYEVSVTYLREHGIPLHDIPTYEIYESYINKSVGGSTKETLERTLQLLYGQTHKHHLKNIDFDELNDRLKPIQDHIAQLYVHPFHGLTELFSWAGKNNISFGIFTSGDRHMIIRNFGVSLPVLGFTDLFQKDDIPIGERFTSFLARAKAIYGIPKLAIATCEDVTRTKPDPEGILKLVEKLQVKNDEVIVLGDHTFDMQAAKKAGLHPFGVTHGFGTPAELTKAGAMYIVEDLTELTQLLSDHNKGVKNLF